MAAVTVSSSPPHRVPYSESHPTPPFKSPLSHMTSHMTNHVNHVTPPTNQLESSTKLSPEESERRRERERRRGGGMGRRERKGGCGEGRGGGGRGEREGRGGEGSGDSTAEEVDVASSTTTDTLPEVSEPVDFIECGHAAPRAYCTSALPHNGHRPIPKVIASSGLQVLHTVCVHVYVYTMYTPLYAHVHVHVCVHVYMLCTFH